MASYYYLASSLPMLRADGGMPFRYEKFLDMCQGCVSAATYQKLENLSVDSSEGPLLAEWAQFYGVLSQEMRFQRNQKLGRVSEQPSVRDEVISRTVTEAVNAENPLEAELRLLDLEFSRLDELIGIHAFDDYMLFGYALKLKLLQRLTSFEKERGEAEFKRLFNHIQEQILSM